ncbi:PH, RCC1 and FYVE domains-containing protein 1 isoform X2 [Nilaparvata lugens]|uniref:PH, RCC1 and FYVE domains-containing protein 1 isoform X2 n=1 Tax=Nilaparvata lugens TaxID=108931 RepID=UPI00193D2BDC|nr:PH, RCC1 and FYVE domains-containing protein 1 isoform X2 [Nilaparvata lugens]XP_039293764.1 PH, RCC1 and FYVE domains-containing protein 1 isoform X2 [Nilaparvata lugens]
MIYLNGLSLFTFSKEWPPNNPAQDALTQSKRNKTYSFTRIDHISSQVGGVIVSVVFSWSYCLLINNFGEAYLVGHLDGKSNNILKLIPPDNGFIIEAACGINNIHLVSKNGKYWLFDKRARIWKNLNQILNVERPEKCEDKQIIVTKVACGTRINLAVDNLGSLFSVPSRLDLRVLVSAVACGKEHALILTTDSTVYSWGTGSRGQLGHGSVDDESHPRELAALCGLRVIAVAAGGWHSCCITEQRDLYAWGWNASGQLGFADDCSVWGCGWNRYHQVCATLPQTIFGMTRLAVPPNLKVNRIICGEWNTAFVAESNQSPPVVE